MKEEFKLFVSSHPELIKYVNKNEMTWQKFYDMYSLYGDKSEANFRYIFKLMNVTFVLNSSSLNLLYHNTMYN